MADTPDARSFIRSWSSNPIPHLSLSAGGLLALADLQTVAQRTAITGGSSWLDALVLSPGLHYQQAADGLDEGPSEQSLFAQLQSAIVNDKGGSNEIVTQGISSEKNKNGDEEKYKISNSAMAHFLKRISSDGDFTFDIGRASPEKTWDRVKRLFRFGRKLKKEDIVVEHIDWLSDLLYIASPLFTTAAMSFMVLFRDWWGLGVILALIVSRILNIIIIKQRSRYDVQPIAPKSIGAGTQSNDDDHAQEQPTQYTIDLGPNRRVLLRGLPSDLHAVCTQAWLRKMSALDSFLEAWSKLIVYLVAALSGNLTQIGNLILMVLLLLSAGLLGLSNVKATGFKVHGRVARPWSEPKEKDATAGGKGEDRVNGAMREEAAVEDPKGR